MVIQLYSEKTPAGEGQIGLIQNLLTRGFIEGQYTPRNIKMQVIKADQVGEAFKNAVKKTKNAQYLDDAEMVLVFQSPKTAPAPEKDAEENPAPEEASEKNDAPEETVSESVKVQDLSKSVGLKTVGTKSCSCGKKTCCCGTKKTVKEEEAPKKPARKEPPKKVKSKKDLEKPEKKGEEKVVDEAEMTATGDELKAKVVDALRRVLYLPDEEEVEMVTLEDFRDGYDTFLTKLSFKE